LAAAHNSSRIVWPLGVSLAVEGQRIRRRLMTGPFDFGALLDRNIDIEVC
jgi:hypothetical protein